jgi:hypothetical protein
MVAVLSFAEHSYEEVNFFTTVELARAFSRGVTTGAGFYSGDSCHAYVMPEEEADMKENEPAGEVERALKDIAPKES